MAASVALSLSLSSYMAAVKSLQSSIIVRNLHLHVHVHDHSCTCIFAYTDKKSKGGILSVSKHGRETSITTLEDAMPSEKEPSYLHVHVLVLELESLCLIHAAY